MGFLTCFYKQKKPRRYRIGSFDFLVEKMGVEPTTS